MTTIKERIVTLLIQLNHGLVDRDTTLKSALLSILAGENILLIGPPGTAKSLIARRITQSFTHEHQANTIPYFEYLLTKFSTPEEIFGPLSISELKQDRFKRNTAGYLPSVKIAFLDEIFKASSSILNALLTIMNERVYHNGTIAEKVPLKALIAASNELPTGQEELNALYDRFLVRSFVDYVSEDKLQHLFELSEDKDIEDPLTRDDLQQLDNSISSITIPDNIKQAVQDIWREHKETFKEDRREQLSDRRLIKVIKLLRVSAATNGRNEVDLSDVLLLKDCLWNHPDNIATVQELIVQTLRRYCALVPINEQAFPIAHETKAAPQQRETNIIKGYSGSGSIDDPLLITNTDELLGLLRPDIGLKGYYFKQMKDIDCSALSSWTPIPFQGHYSGGYFTIKRREQNEALFADVQPKSNVTELYLVGFSLANRIYSSEVLHCKTNLNIAIEIAKDSHFEASESDNNFINSSAENCKFYACLAGKSLINGQADGCIIKQCQTGSSLCQSLETDKAIVEGRLDNSTISNCLIVLRLENEFGNLLSSSQRSGLANWIGNTKITNTLVTGKIPDNTLIFCGFAEEADNESEISNSAIGPLQLGRLVDAVTGILRVPQSCTLRNNATIDSVKIVNRTNDPNGKDGRSVAVAQFNQYFFEHTLDWDFKKIWQWNADTNLPGLQKVGINATGTPNSNNENSINSVDLLTIQIKANIWL
jgi:MoxR-like ATPase